MNNVNLVKTIDKQFIEKLANIVTAPNLKKQKRSQENINYSSQEDNYRYNKMQSFIFEDKKNGNSRHYGIPANDRELEYRDTIKNLVSELRESTSKNL